MGGRTRVVATWWEEETRREDLLTWKKPEGACWAVEMLFISSECKPDYILHIYIYKTLSSCTPKSFAN